MELSENTFYFWSYHIIMKFKLIDIIPQWCKTFNFNFRNQKKNNFDLNPQSIAECEAKHTKCCSNIKMIILPRD